MFFAQLPGLLQEGIFQGTTSFLENLRRWLQRGIAATDPTASPDLMSFKLFRTHHFDIQIAI